MTEEPTPVSEEHDWKPTSATHALSKCQKCGSVGFAPHPLPRTGCVPGEEDE